MWCKGDATAVALVDSAGSLTYAHLRARVSEVVREWGGDMPTGAAALALPASRELVAGVLAALETRRAFLLLGDDTPAEHALEAVQACSCDVVWIGGSASHAAWAPSLHTLGFGSSTGMAGTFIAPPPPNAMRIALPGDRLCKAEPAYIIPTSGSSGRPKLVAIARDSLALYCDWYATAFELSASDCVGFTCAVAFDMAINALLPPLMAGSTVAIPDSETLRNPARLLAFLQERKVTFLNTTPSVGRMLRSAWAMQGGARRRPLEDLRVVMFGGEALSCELVRQWREVAPHASVYNCYGVAEATVTSFFYEVPKPDLAVSGTLPIGRPVDHVEFDVVDAAGAPVRVGDPGELVLRGRLVGLGYVGESAPSDTFHCAGADTRPSAYRTGDRVYQDANGMVCFVGRDDRQVKAIGGFRVDLGELESAFRRVLPEGADVAAVAAGEAGAEHFWVFCTAPAEEQRITEYLDQVAQLLPPYKRPRGASIITQIPIAPGGKVDYALLRTLAGEEAQRSRVRDERSRLGDLLARAWADALPGIARPQERDDFFRLGGSSFDFMRLVDGLDSALGGAIDVARLLESSTFGRQLDCLVQGRRIELSEHHVGQSYEVAPELHARSEVALLDVAVRLPGMPDVPSFRALLRSGRRSIASDAFSRFVDMTPTAAEGRSSVPGSFFDASELSEILASGGERFSVLQSQQQGPREVDATDPQQLLWALCADELLGKLPPDVLHEKRVGIYVGMGPTFFDGEDRTLRRLTGYSLPGTTPSFAPGRLAYLHDLRGANIVVDTACSSSLVAVHLACQALRSGEVDIAVAGGVQLFHSKRSIDMLREAGILSLSGCCQPFAETADGYLPSEGTGAVLLSTQETRLKLGASGLVDVLASAVNHGGRAATATTPSMRSHVSLYSELCQRACVGMSDLALIEAHATGTALGDPVEVAGLRTFLQSVEATSPVYVSSGKANIGHTHYAAGVLGLIRTVLQLDDREVYPHAIEGPLNRRLQLDGTRLCVPRELVPLPDGLAMVSSFGISGTNCAVLVGQPGSARTLALGVGTRDMPAASRPIWGRTAFRASPIATAAADGRTSDTRATVCDIAAAAGEATGARADVRASLRRVLERRRAGEGRMPDTRLSAIGVGFDSIECLQLADELSADLGVELSPTIFLDEPSLDAVAQTASAALENIERSAHESGVPVPEAAAPRHETADPQSLAEVVALCAAHTRLIERAGARQDAALQLEVLAALWREQYKMIEAVARQASSVRPVDRADASVRPKATAWVLEAVGRACGLPADRVRPDDSLVTDLGISSLARMQVATDVLARLPSEQGLLDRILACETVADIIELCEKRTSNASWTELS